MFRSALSAWQRGPLELAIQEGQGPVPGVLRRGRTIPTPWIVLVGEGVPGAGVDLEVHLLARAPQGRLELSHLIRGGTLVVGAEIPQHRRLDAADRARVGDR